MKPPGSQHSQPLLSCPSGGWPLNLLEVLIVGSVQYKRLAVYGSQKTLAWFAWLTELTGFAVDLVDKVDIVNKVDRVDTLDKFDKVD